MLMYQYVLEAPISRETQSVRQTYFVNVELMVEKIPRTYLDFSPCRYHSNVEIYEIGKLTLELFN